MALKDLYNAGRVSLSDLCFDKGVVEVGGAEHVAPLWCVQEERPKMEEGEKVYGRTKEGVIVVPANYGFLNSSDAPRRGLVPRGLPLINPEEAVESNINDNFYAPDVKKYAEAVFSALMSVIPIDERDVKNDVLGLMLNSFTSTCLKYTLPLYGGEGSDKERMARVESARNYFKEHLVSPGKKKAVAQRLFLPSLEAGKKEIIGTQIYAGGLDDEFGLSGGGRGLHGAGGVFRV